MTLEPILFGPGLIPLFGTMSNALFAIHDPLSCRYAAFLSSARSRFAVALKPLLEKNGVYVQRCCSVSCSYEDIPLRIFFLAFSI